MKNGGTDEARRASGSPPRRGRGRPARVTAAQIAEAALAVGLDQATIRTVAERLDMSVPGLYHHVRTREDLLAMAAAHSLGELPIPADRGQPWTDWLLEYGRFVYDALVAQPEIIGQVLAGTYSSFRLAQHLERVFAVLTSRGFTVAEADLVWHRVSAAVDGAAVAEIGRRAVLEAGHPRADDLRRAVHALGAEQVPLVDRLVASAAGTDGSDHLDSFDTVHLVVEALEHRYPGRAAPGPPTAPPSRPRRKTRP